MDIPAHPDLQSIAGEGLLGAAIVCARFDRFGLPCRRGGIFYAAFGVAVPLDGGRCVPCTGVRLDYPLGGGLASSVAVLVPTAPLFCTLLLQEGRRAASEGDGGGGGPRAADSPIGGIGNSLTVENMGGRKVAQIIRDGMVWMLCARAVDRDPTLQQQ